MGDKVVLFSGYAPVHFACFKPLFDRLYGRSGLEIVLSGGTRMMTPRGVRYDPGGLYDEFDLPAGVVRPFQEIQDLDVDVLFSSHTGKIAPPSVRHSVQIFHGMSFRNLAIRDAAEGFDSYFLLGPYMQRGFIAREIFTDGDARMVQVGFPKTDRLLDGTVDRRTVAEGLGFAGERPVVLYAPTGAKGNSLETFGEEALRALAAQDAYDIVVKLHDHPKGWVDWFERLSVHESAHFRMAQSPDVIPLQLLADVLITDASSVANEYALLDRPIVFLDVPELIAAAQATGAMVDLATWGRKGGQVVARPDEMVAAVADAIQHPERQSDVRRAMASDLFFNPGTATDAATAWLAENLGL